ncbi:hypothetical protein G5714_000123 [Onychostoma macrolepis]|uniref:Uncharacterized protein n=1 Tax=Onychostoma macrolepis TaxID=369639 RepID=A0A7J6DFJ1_9TELE|nr:hypothetical protein G5714_000123 [Onychostoma macrolepis]
MDLLLTKYTLPDAELSSETLIGVSKHLGNLKYQVWEKMKDICPHSGRTKCFSSEQESCGVGERGIQL